MKQNKPDMTDTSMDLSTLEQAKAVEKKHSKKPLTRVNILNGYVLTNCPKRWEHLEVKPG